MSNAHVDLYKREIGVMRSGHPGGVSTVNDYLLALEVDDGVLASVFEQVLVGGDGVIGQDLGKPVGASGVHQVGQKLHVPRPELVLVLEVDVHEVPLADLPGDGVQLAVVAGDDGQHPGELVVDEVVVVAAVVEGVKGEPVEEGALVLGLADDERDLGELAGQEDVLGLIRKHDPVDGGGEPPREGEEHLEQEPEVNVTVSSLQLGTYKHLVGLLDNVLLGLTADAVDQITAGLGGAFQSSCKFDGSFMGFPLDILIAQGVSGQGDRAMEKTVGQG